MFPALLDWCREIRKAHLPMPGRVLEVGAFDVNGNPRSLFPDAPEYIGVDQVPGGNVDRVLNAHDLARVWPVGYFDTVLCFETLEHDPKFWLTLEAIRTVLRPGGALLITTPTLGFPVHRYPKDYWRPTEDAFTEVFFEGCRLVSLETRKDTIGQPCLCGAGFRL